MADVEARQRLRSSSSSSLIVSRTRLLTVGDRAFPIAAERVCNSLSDLVTSAPSVAVFWSRLKTHLCNISYPLPCDCLQCLSSDFSCFGHSIRFYLLTYLLTCSLDCLYNLPTAMSIFYPILPLLLKPLVHRFAVRTTQLSLFRT